MKSQTVWFNSSSAGVWLLSFSTASVLKLALLAFALGGPQFSLFAASHYIRAGADGANTGSSWADAWTNFGSVTWTRGDMYYLAGGNYLGDVSISAAESGSNRVTLKKANAGDNSGDSGWNSAYETTQAIIQGFLTIGNSYITIDGVTGSGTNGHGIKIYQPVVGAGNAVINYASAKNFLIFTHVELEGPGYGYPVGASGFKQNNVTSLSKGNYLGHLYFHELSQNGFVFVNMAGTSYSDYGLIFENIVLSNCGHNLAGQHGQGIQGGSGAAGSTNRYWIIRNSIFHNVIGTGAIAFLGYSRNDHVDIYNNIFHNMKQSFDGTNWVDYVTLRDAFSPGVIYFSSTSASALDVRIYNNTFYNITRNTIYFGCSTLANNEVVNNLFLKGHFNQTHVGVTGSYNDYYDCIPIVTSGIYGVPYGELGQRGEAFSPCVDVVGGDFRLIPGANAIGNGKTLSSVFTTDIAGNSRSEPWDIGAFEYVPDSLAVPPLSPENLRVGAP